MSWLEFLRLGGQIFAMCILLGISLDFLVYRVRRAWLKASVDVVRNLNEEEKKSALKEAMTKK